MYEMKDTLRQFGRDVDKAASEDTQTDDFRPVLQNNGAQTLDYSDQILRDLITNELFQIILPLCMLNSKAHFSEMKQGREFYFQTGKRARGFLHGARHNQKGERSFLCTLPLLTFDPLSWAPHSVSDLESNSLLIS